MESVYVDRMVRLTNEERLILVRSLGILERSLEVVDSICSPEFLLKVRTLSRVLCEENWRNDFFINSPKVRPVSEDSIPPKKKRVCEFNDGPDTY
jgi:hypothetical protein